MLKLIEKLLDYMYSDKDFAMFVTLGFIGIIALSIIMGGLMYEKKLDRDLELAKITAGQILEAKK